MGIVARFPLHQIGDDDDLAVRHRRGGEKIRHPRVVIGAAVDDEPGIGDRPRGRGTGLEGMRVLIRIGQDAGDLHRGPADLLRQIAVEILGGDDGEGLGMSGKRGEQQSARKKGEQPHHGSPSGKASAARSVMLYHFRRQAARHGTCSRNSLFTVMVGEGRPSTSLQAARLCLSIIPRDREAKNAPRRYGAHGGERTSATSVPPW